jgi:uncharacterized cupredoxin-like copper-binding protein
LITKGIIESDKLEITAGKETAVYADLVLNVEPHLQLFLVENANGAMKALENLETIFKGKTQARKTELKRQSNNIKMKDGEEVSRFIARTQELRHELVSVGHALGDDDVVDAVLEGLPKRSDMVVTAIQTADKRPWRYWSDQARCVVRGYQPSSTVKTTRTRKVAQKNAETIGYYCLCPAFDLSSFLRSKWVMFCDPRGLPMTRVHSREKMLRHGCFARPGL